MGSRLYVGNLSYSTTDASLRAAFEPFGQVTSASVMIDRMSSRSRGFGFVEFSSDAEAKQAIEGLHGSELDGRQLTVNEARAREEGGPRGGGARPPRGGGFSGGGRSWDSAPREQSSFGGGGYSGGGGYAGGGGGGGRGESEGGGRGKGGGRRNDRGRDRRRQDDNDW